METDTTKANTEEAGTITRLSLGQREVILVGTAHVSSRSVEEVREVIVAERPDRVCVEIDRTRYASLVEKKSWESLNIVQVLKEGKGFLLLANLVLSSFQRRLGADLGVTPGEEMLAAVRTCEDQGIQVDLCDRDIQVTLRRAWARSGLWGKNKMLAAMLSSVFTNEKLDAAEIEKLKSRGAFQSMMDELAEYLPSVKEVLIDERDHFLASRIFQAQGAKIVAVIGAGHVQGIVRDLKRMQEGELSTDTTAIESIPRKKTLARLLPWLIPAAILALIVAGFFRSGWSLSLSMLWKWFLVTGTLSAIGSILALAHPLTVVAGFLAAPFTTLNPTIGVGLVTGIVEAALRKPRVTDFEELPTDLLSLKGFYRNRITRILIVFLLSSIGASIGTFIGIPYLSSLLR
jgi:pheromone shutdown-related protein TraB